MHRIDDTLTQVKNQIHSAARAHHRNNDEITLLAVSKKQDAEKLRSAYTAGQRHFGENYLQEALDKQAELKELDIAWHFIGPIQSNKTRAIAEHFDWVHSVDRLKIAQRLSLQRSEYIHAQPEQDHQALNICLQVNLDGETSKAGIPESEIRELALACSVLPRVKVRGLMAIPAPRDNFNEQRQVFARLRNALSSLKNELPELDTLSMGMSADMEAAVAEGATIVRVGTAIFGARDK